METTSGDSTPTFAAAVPPDYLTDPVFRLDGISVCAECGQPYRLARCPNRKCSSKIRGGKRVQFRHTAPPLEIIAARAKSIERSWSKHERRKRWQHPNSRAPVEVRSVTIILSNGRRFGA